MSKKSFDDDVLRYHEAPRPGKLEVVPSKPCQNQRDLSLAYTPGVALPCRRIEANPDDAYRYTMKGNLVAVVTNGSAVLGLGNIGPLASKPVMEGKGVLFKRFAGIDVFDIELDAPDTETFIDTVRALAPTFGGINLEDIAAPACFEIEDRLSSELDIPVFHDDQHGTAIIVCAALKNALRLQNKQFDDVSVVIAGAGAAAVAIAKLMFSLGVDPARTLMCDSRGVIHDEREDLSRHKAEFARPTAARTLADAMRGTDVFIGVSVGGTVDQDMVRSMAPCPIVMALANPDPEITFPDACAARDDLIMATGRSDYPNQVNNVLGFPFLFRGALDVRARAINEAMKHAAVEALARLARKPVPQRVLRAYGLEELEFGPEYIIPKPLDGRVLLEVAPAVAQAAIDSGVARDTIDDVEAYVSRLASIQGPAYAVLEPLRAEARTNLKRIAFPEGTRSRIVQAAARLVDEELAEPILIGDRDEIVAQLREFRIPEDAIEIHDPRQSDARDTYAESFWKLRQRKGATRDAARLRMTNPFYYTAMMLRHGDVDGVVAGHSIQYPSAIRPALRCLGTDGAGVLTGVYALAFRDRLLFAADCTINIDPSADELCEIAFHAARVARAFDVDPVVAMLSFSSFGSVRHPRVERIQEAVRLVKAQNPDFPIDGEFQANVAFERELRERDFPFCDIDSDPNVLIFPDLESGNIGYNLLSTIGGATAIGPILVGLNGAYAALRMGVDVDNIVDMAVITAAAAI